MTRTVLFSDVQVADIRAGLTERDLSQRAVAKQLGYDPAVLCRWIANDINKRHRVGVARATALVEAVLGLNAGEAHSWVFKQSHLPQILQQLQRMLKVEKQRNTLARMGFEIVYLDAVVSREEPLTYELLVLLIQRLKLDLVPHVVWNAIQKTPYWAANELQLMKFEGRHSESTWAYKSGLDPVLCAAVLEYARFVNEPGAIIPGATVQVLVAAKSLPLADTHEQWLFPIRFTPYIVQVIVERGTTTRKKVEQAIWARLAISRIMYPSRTTSYFKGDQERYLASANASWAWGPHILGIIS